MTEQTVGKFALIIIEDDTLVDFDLQPAIDEKVAQIEACPEEKDEPVIYNIKLSALIESTSHLKDTFEQAQSDLGEDSEAVILFAGALPENGSLEVVAGYHAVTEIVPALQQYIALQSMYNAFHGMQNTH